MCLSACPLTSDFAEAFREICPAGHGYTYSSSHIRLAMRKAEEEELARPSREQAQKSYGTLPGPAERQPLRAVTDTWLEAETIPDKGIWAGWKVPEAVPFPLKELLGIYSGSMAFQLWSIRRGRLEQQHPTPGTSSPGVPGRPHLLPIMDGGKDAHIPRVASGSWRGQQQPPPQLLRSFYPLPLAMQRLGLVLAARPEELAGRSRGSGCCRSPLWP